MMLRLRTIVTALLVLPCIAFGGMRIDLRPEGLTVLPGNPPSVTAAPGVYNVDVWLVDTGSPQGNIPFRGLFFDSADTTGITPSSPFRWFGTELYFATYNFPNVAWVYLGMVANPAYQLVLPDNGEILVGDFNVTVDADGGLLDLMNADNPDINFGARADFGFEVLPNDPITTWRAHTGEITGGRLAFVPEPTSLMLLTVGALSLARKQRKAMEFKE